MEISAIERHREILLRHARHPVRTGPMSDAHARGSCKNPLCGDHIEVLLKFQPTSGQVDDIRIQVSACAIATASASLMTGLVIGRTRPEVLSLVELVTKTLSGLDSEIWPDLLHELKPFETLRTNPRKIPCSLIAWFALKDSIVSFQSFEVLIKKNI